MLDFGIARLTRGGRKLTADRVGDRHARLHGARAGARRARHHAARRRVLARLRAVRVPDRARRVRGRGGDGAAGQDPAPGRAARARGRARACRARSTTWWRACWPRTRRSAWPTRAAVIAALDALRRRWRELGGRDGGAAAGAPQPALTAERAAHRLRRHRRAVAARPSGAGAARRAPLAPSSRRAARPARPQLRPRSRRSRTSWRACTARGCTRCPTARWCIDAARRRQGDRSGGARGALRAGRCARVLPDVPLVVVDGPGRFSAWSVVGRGDRQRHAPAARDGAGRDPPRRRDRGPARRALRDPARRHGAVPARRARRARGQAQPARQGDRLRRAASASCRC